MFNKSFSHASGNISPEALVSFVRDLLGGFPNPDDPQPPGPWDPIIRAALERAARFGPHPDPWLDAMGPHPEPWHALAGPYPVPWHTAFGSGSQLWPAALIHIIARRHPELWDLFGGGPLSRVALNPQPLPPGMVFAAALADELIGRAASAVEIADWLPPQQGEERGIIIVGGRVLRYVDEICGNDIKFRFPRPGPRPGWWRERLEGAELVAMGVRFEGAAAASEALGETFAQAGDKLVQAGMSKLGQ